MIVVICKGEDGEIAVFGPFNDEAWARAWIKQHDHNPYNDDPELAPASQEQEAWERLLDSRLEDEDHWCQMAAGLHETQRMPQPGFDPNTLPLY